VIPIKSFVSTLRTELGQVSNAVLCGRLSFLSTKLLKNFPLLHSEQEASDRITSRIYKFIFLIAS
jgi:hypothetical protein